MTNSEIKTDMIAALFNRGGYIKQVDGVEYRTRCPYCGDSQKNLNTGHLYIRINPDDNFPMVWNCFKCSESGVVDKEFLSMMEIDDLSLKSSIATLNKTSDKLKAYQFLNNTKTIFFDYKRPEITRGDKISYLENRMGLSLNDDDLQKMKVITSFREFLILNNIKELMCDSQTAFRIEDHFVGFLSYGNSHILFRDITEKDFFRWIKYPITMESKQCRLFYSMESEIDLFTKETITINLSEGVLDATSCCLNLDNNKPNTMNIAVCGKQYDSVIGYLVSMGFVGDNIKLNIYADNDKEFNKNKNNKPTDLKYFQTVMRKLKFLFGEVNIYYNTIKKDIGVPRQEISLKKHRL